MLQTQICNTETGGASKMCDPIQIIIKCDIPPTPSPTWHPTKSRPSVWYGGLGVGTQRETRWVAVVCLSPRQVGRPQCHKQLLPGKQMRGRLSVERVPSPNGVWDAVVRRGTATCHPLCFGIGAIREGCLWHKGSQFQVESAPVPKVRATLGKALVHLRKGYLALTSLRLRLQ